MSEKVASLLSSRLKAMENKVREDNVNVNFRANKLSNDKFGRTATSLVKTLLRLREQLHSRYG